jgi:hypothetical protein
VDLESVYAMIGGTENSNSIEYRYYADGYYAVRIGRAAYESWAAENQSEMTLTLTAKESMGVAYIDALAVKEDKALEVNGKDISSYETREGESKIDIEGGVGNISIEFLNYLENMPSLS